LFSRHSRGGDCNCYGEHASNGGHGSHGGYGSNGGNGSHGGSYRVESEPNTAGYRGDDDPGQPPAAPELRGDAGEANAATDTPR
jgi:hypothetical protein